LNNQANRSRTNETHRRWVTNNKEKEYARVSAYAKAHPEKARNRKKLWRKHNPEKHLATLSTQLLRYKVSLELKPSVLIMDSHQCQLCNFKTALVLHHIVPVKFNLPLNLLHNPANLVILCSCCHLGGAHAGRFTGFDPQIASLLLLKVFHNTPILIE
jgi:5-methylcytosine-specific restriction endonuclease McrA